MQRRLLILYGSETGQAEAISQQIYDQCLNELTVLIDKFGLQIQRFCLDETENSFSLENEEIVIFVVSTTGEGEPPEKARKFYRRFRKQSVDKNLLSNLWYTLLGLGDTNYERFANFGRQLDKRLKQLSAKHFYRTGFADDAVGLEIEVEPWIHDLLPAILHFYKLQSSGADMELKFSGLSLNDTSDEDFNKKAKQKVVTSRKYRLITHSDLPPNEVFRGEVERINSFDTQKPPFDAKNPFLAPVLVNRELYSGRRSCLHIELGLTDSDLKYSAGDHLIVFPMNSKVLVEKIGSLLNTNLDEVITLDNLDERSSKRHPFPCPTTYRNALLYYCDITGRPRSRILRELCEYTTNEDHKTFLKTIVSTTEEGKQLYSEWITKSFRTIVDVLEDLPSVKPPLDFLLELLPRLQPRYYSISSSPKLYPDSVHLTAVVIEYETPTNRINRGVTTNWLKEMQPSPQDPNKVVVPIFIRRSLFRLPADPQTPIIMIGPGTGLAPFRGFIQERCHLKQNDKCVVGDTILYFGCRKKSEDFLYEDELNKYVENKTLTKLYTAFSRDDSNKIHVTHLLKDNMKEIWNIMDAQNGHIYVCGDSRNMAPEVKQIIVQIIISEGNKTKSEAQTYLKTMESQRRYSADVWT